MYESLQDIIKQWFAIAKNGPETLRTQPWPDPFFQFVAVWVAFNALVTARYSVRTGTILGDRQLVNRFCRDPRARRVHAGLRRHDTVYNDAIRLLSEKPVLDMQQESVPEEARDDRYVPDSIDAQGSLWSVLHYIYTVRCNLFHGGKRPDHPRDEALVTAGYEIVSRLITPFFQDEPDDPMWQEISAYEQGRAASRLSRQGATSPRS
jgi:hypothetical protein